MKRFLFCCLTAGILLLSSCSAVSNLESTDNQISQVQSAIVEKIAEQTQASSDAINQKDDALALSFNLATIKIVGAPTKPIDISNLINPNNDVVYFNSLNTANQKLVTENNKLNADKVQLQKQVFDEAAKEESSVAWSKFWGWAFSITGLCVLGGLIFLCVTAPELIPILGSCAGAIFGELVTLFTAIITSIGGLLTKKAS